MKRSLSIGVLLLAVAVALPAVAESAGSLWKKGHDAEMRQDYEAAYNFYKQAFDQKPKDIRYRTSYERGKFLAAASHVHKGQALRDQGKLQEALAEFDTATKIDGSSFIAQQELRRTREMIDKAANPDQQPATPQLSPMVSRLASSGGPVELTPISDTPITLNVTEDTKVIYETVGKLAGINVLFDPDYTSRRIHIALNGVTLQDALALISMESKTFWRAVTTNTIFVAADTPAKRKELEQNVLKTFYLSNISSPTELQDLVNTLRTVLEIRLMTPLPTQNAVVIRATPDQVALAEKLINDLDKARPEVVVEVAVLQVTREKLRNLGISPPTSAVVQLNSNINTSSNNNNNNNNNNSAGASNGSVNLNHLGNLTAKDFTVTIPQATVNALYSDSNTKLIQNPQIRALDGQKASLKIGDRVPVATGSFGAGLGGVGLNSLVNTQFNYIDVGVNVDITPVVHGTREVTLKVMLDVSNVTNQVNIGGINQPQIGQRKIEHQIRLREGEVNILGGIFEDSDIKSISGLPFLSQVPLLKYLFSSTNTDKRENEIVFVMIPHIVRSQDLSPLNMRAIEIGTGNNIDIRRAAGSAPVQAAPANPPRGGAAAAQPGTPGPGTPAAGTNPAAGQQQQPAGAATLAFEPQIINQTVGQTFAVDVTMTGDNIYSVPLQIGYDPKTLQLLNVSNGTFLSRDGQIVSLTRRDDPSTGSVTITASRPPNANGVSGQGSVFTLTFMAKSAGESSLVITKAGVRDAGMQAVNVSGSQAHVNIK